MPKMRVDGPSHRILFQRVDQLDSLMASELHRIVGEVVPHLTLKAITAAGLDEEPYAESEPSHIPTPEAPIVIDWQGLSVVQTLWVNSVAFKLFPLVEASFIESAGEVHTNATEAFPERADGLPPVGNEMSEQYLLAAKNRMVAVGDRLWQVIRTELSDGFAKGESIDELKDRLVASAGLTEPRARTVARTEVISASNAGSLAQAQVLSEVGMTVQKEWLATEDMRTRPTHALADGQKVGINDGFTVGGATLAFPGDPSGPPGEIINCRCTVTYDVEDDQPAIEHKTKPALTATGWAWNGLEHAEFCQSPKHPGPCKGWKGTGPAPTTHGHKHAKAEAPKEHAHAHAGGGGGGGAAPAESKMTSFEATHTSFPEKKAGIESLSSAEKQKIYVSFKDHKGVSPAYSGKAIYESMQAAKAAHPQHNLTDADVLHIIDEQGTSMGHTAKAGPDAYKNKVTAWLQTPNGKKVATEHLKKNQGHIPEAPKHETTNEHKIELPNDAAMPAGPADKNYTLGDTAKAISAQHGDTSGFSAEKKKQIAADYASILAKMPPAAHTAGEGSWQDKAMAKQIQAFELAANQHGITTLQAIKATDEHYGFGKSSSYENVISTYLKKHGAPAGVPHPKTEKSGAPKKLKIETHDLPNGEFGATGYKGLSKEAKLKMGTTADVHTLPPEKQQAVYQDVLAGVKAKTGSSYNPVDQNAQAYMDTFDEVAQKHGISMVQAMKIYDKKSYGWGNKQHTEKTMYKHAKALGGVHNSNEGKVPDTSKLSPEKKAALGESVFDQLNDVQASTVSQAMAQQGIHAGSSNADVFKSASKVGTHLGFSAHDVLKMMDAHAAKTQGVENKHHYETKGVLYVKQASTQHLKTANSHSTVYNGVIKATGPHAVDPPPNKNAAPGTEFKIITGEQAQHMQDHEMGAFTPAEKTALKKYTSSYYKDINTYLRSGGTTSTHAAATAVKVQDAMRPITQDLTLVRGATVHGFGMHDVHDLPSLVGKTYEDRGFLSTSVGGKAAFGGQIKLTIHAPKGTHAAYVNDFSHFKGENELLLAAGTRYKVKSVKPPTSSDYQWNVVVEVVSDVPNV